ncbi:MAG: hypothetical protein J7485_05470 [Sphingobium sp.]|nr:hypothetical protein [Sphingobium sp.]
MKENHYFNISDLEDISILSYNDIFLKKILHDVYTRRVESEDPFVFSIFREPLDRLFSDYRMCRRWREEGFSGSDQFPSTVDLYDNPKTMKYFSESLNQNFIHFTNHYAYRLLGQKYQIWLRFRLAFHDGDLEPDGLIIEEALRAVDTIDLPFLLENFAKTHLLYRAVSSGQYDGSFGDLFLNHHDDGPSLSELSPEDRNLIEKCCKIDQIIYEKIQKIVAGIDYESEISRIISEDDSIIVDFEDGIPVQNCYPRECNPPKFSTWSREGGLRLPFMAKNPREKRLHLRISNFLKREFLDEVFVSCGQQRVEHELIEKHGLFYLSASLSGDLFEKDRRQDITIWSPAEAVGRSDDKRIIGIEASGLSIISAAH